MKTQFQLTFVLIFCATLFAGCGGGRPELAEVTGVLSMNGEPMANVELRFIPNAEHGNTGNYSVGKTDENGRYTLVYADDSETPGVSIGATKIILRDLDAAFSGREDAPIEPRFGEEYTMGSSTPLSYDVVAGSQEHNINIEY